MIASPCSSWAPPRSPAGRRSGWRRRIAKGDAEDEGSRFRSPRERGCRLSCDGGDSAKDRNIRRASALARFARAGSFDFEGRGFSRRVRRRAPPQTRLRQWRDAMHRLGVHQARANIGSGELAAEPAAYETLDPASDPRGPATGYKSPIRFEDDAKR